MPTRMPPHRLSTEQLMLAELQRPPIRASPAALLGSLRRRGWQLQARQVENQRRRRATLQPWA
jgi:hypothetical protein